MGGQRSKPVSFPPCPDGEVAASILVMGVYKVTLLLLPPQQVPEGEDTQAE